MSNPKLRQQIAFDAARLMYHRQEAEYLRAKLKAARRICRGWVKPADLPTNREIRDQIQIFARIYEGEQRNQDLRDMRLEALRLMRVLQSFRPRLIGSVLTGHVRRGSDIDLHVFSDQLEAVVDALASVGAQGEVEYKRVRKGDEERVFTHIHVEDRFPVEVTVYSRRDARRRFRSSITGKPIEFATIRQLEQLLAKEYQELRTAEGLNQAVDATLDQVDRFQFYRMLLLPLEQVRQDPRYHPEGDVLYHSLQVFELMTRHRPWDEELLLAALLHDVGKGIDASEHVTAGLEALGETITPRTGWFIKHHMLAHTLREGALGKRAHRRLAEHEDYDDLLLLGRCDREGRVCGAETPDLDEALAYVRDLAEMCGE